MFDLCILMHRMYYIFTLNESGVLSMTPPLDTYETCDIPLPPN